MLASRIYPRVKHNCWCILLILVSGIYWNDGTALSSCFRHTHSVQFILDSRISEHFRSGCMESVTQGILERTLPERRHC